MNSDEIKNYFSNPEQTPLQQIVDDIFIEKQIKLYIKRDDLIDAHINGNKFFKLKYNLIEAAEKNFSTLLSFGGAYSNHIYSLAYAGKKFDFSTIGVIRGEEHLPLNPTLQFARECGMKFYYLDRSDYRKKIFGRNYIKTKKIHLAISILFPRAEATNLPLRVVLKFLKDFRLIIIMCFVPAALAEQLRALLMARQSIQKCLVLLF